MTAIRHTSHSDVWHMSHSDVWHTPRFLSHTAANRPCASSISTTTFTSTRWKYPKVITLLNVPCSSIYISRALHTHIHTYIYVFDFVSRASCRHERPCSRTPTRTRTRPLSPSMPLSLTPPFLSIIQLAQDTKSNTYIYICICWPMGQVYISTIYIYIYHPRPPALPAKLAVAQQEQHYHDDFWELPMGQVYIRPVVFSAL